MRVSGTPNERYLKSNTKQTKSKFTHTQNNQNHRKPLDHHIHDACHWKHIEECYSDISSENSANTIQSNSNINDNNKNKNHDPIIRAINNLQEKVLRRIRSIDSKQLLLKEFRQKQQQLALLS